MLFDFSLSVPKLCVPIVFWCQGKIRKVILQRILPEKADVLIILPAGFGFWVRHAGDLFVLKSKIKNQLSGDKVKTREGMLWPEGENIGGINGCKPMNFLYLITYLQSLRISLLQLRGVMPQRQVKRPEETKWHCLPKPSTNSIFYRQSPCVTINIVLELC